MGMSSSADVSTPNSTAAVGLKKILGESFFTDKVGQLVGGFNPTHLKNISQSQIGNLPQIGVKINKYLKPPHSRQVLKNRVMKAFFLLAD